MKKNIFEISYDNTKNLDFANASYVLVDYFLCVLISLRIFRRQNQESKDFIFTLISGEVKQKINFANAS
jgi:hypothetical protein